MQFFEPGSVELFYSRGYLTPTSKLLMRFSVILSDFVFYIPAYYLFVNIFYSGQPQYYKVWFDYCELYTSITYSI